MKEGDTGVTGSRKNRNTGGENAEPYSVIMSVFTVELRGMSLELKFWRYVYPMIIGSINNEVPILMIEFQLNLRVFELKTIKCHIAFGISESLAGARVAAPLYGRMFLLSISQVSERMGRVGIFLE